MPTTTLASLFNDLTGKAWRKKILESPPDVFALAATALARTGAYLPVVSTWPPRGYKKDAWGDLMKKTGREWRRRLDKRNTKPPAEVHQRWKTIVANSAISLRELASVGYDSPAGKSKSQSSTVCRNLLELMAIADEATEGVGIPDEEGHWRQGLEEEILVRFYRQLLKSQSSSLCKFIESARMTVLPKLLTPQTGITIRSLSHNLALTEVSEVVVRWSFCAQALWKRTEPRHGLNALIVPWPTEIRAFDFQPAHPRKGNLREMGSENKEMGFFCFKTSGPSRVRVKALDRLVRNAQNAVGMIDFVILPELALTPRELNSLARMLIKIRPRPPILIAGVAIPADQGRIVNASVTLLPLQRPPQGKVFEYARFDQVKHHRWKLDESQIAQYGLGATLDPTFEWWENSVVPRRELWFMSMNPWLTLCTLLCEDLARPDPIADIVRAVGPNLIIALLLDGPQMARRWPGRYGTVMADDPGSSVLTVTSLGMAEKSRARGKLPLRTIALWKDPLCGEAIEIDLPEKNEAAVLCLTRRRCVQFTADNRHDDQAASHFNLTGIHFI